MGDAERVIGFIIAEKVVIIGEDDEVVFAEVVIIVHYEGCTSLFDGSVR